MNSRVVLKPMTEETYQIYLRQHEEDYARDRMTTDRETFEEALRTTRAQHEAMLPQGVRTPGHYFFTVEDPDRGQLVGFLWFACRATDGTLSLYHILIQEAERRKGYGRLTLDAVAE